MAPLYRRGDHGPPVVEVRDRLARLGLLEFPVVGDPAALEFDDNVDEAVRLFQQSRSLIADGIVGPETFRRLEEARWSLGDRVL
ncbi:MAG: N-acetylmuramoyl-L-alanine amidase, partial [Actinobacteria bacterium]|nr:N-acetylmuramoyl-L-alanine amidase [Actinomycetota bacterium]